MSESGLLPDEDPRGIYFGWEQGSPRALGDEKLGRESMQATEAEINPLDESTYSNT